MAYSFGGGVRPELGKTDYSGYLQGALTGAQGVAGWWCCHRSGDC
jgi:hypothetical protein